MSPDESAEAAVQGSAPRQHPLPAPRFEHLRSLTARAGMSSDAGSAEFLVAPGFSTDDNARALVVVCRQSGATGGLADLAATYLGFVLDSRAAGGAFRDRRDATGAWSEPSETADTQAHAWWALGTAAHRAATAWMRRSATEAFASCASFDVPHLRSNAYATLGAVEMLAADPNHHAARDVLHRTSGVISDAALDGVAWPERRIGVDAARLPDALIAAGTLLGDDHLVASGLRLLEWLIGVEFSGHRFIATQGSATAETRVLQRPLEAWALADACHRAWIATHNPAWRARVFAVAGWLMGANETGAQLYDPDTGATLDGLQPTAVNGTESTLSGLAILQDVIACRPPAA